MRLNNNFNDELPILFTGDAIAQLEPSAELDLKLWEWHEEAIDGRQYRIVTHRRIDSVSTTAG